MLKVKTKSKHIDIAVKNIDIKTSSFITLLMLFPKTLAAVLIYKFCVLINVMKPCFSHENSRLNHKAILITKIFSFRKDKFQQ